MYYKTYSLPEALSPGATLTVYMQYTPPGLMIQKRPAVLICPGGGYSEISQREGELLALRFLAMGCHAAVLTYSVAPHRYPTQLKEAAYSMAFLREHAVEWQIDADKILILGCSAGGHLAAHLGTHWHEAWLAKALNTTNEAIRPNGMILCYPVITSGAYAHKGSILALLGEQADETLWESVSLEHKVTRNTPPTFIWHTLDDEVVPSENALLFVSALKQAGVSCEFHLYPHGLHGLVLATEQTAFANGLCLQKECAGWITLVQTWIEHL